MKTNYRTSERKINDQIYNNDFKKFQRTNESFRPLYNKPSLQHFLGRQMLKWVENNWRAEVSLVNTLTAMRPPAVTKYLSWQAYILVSFQISTI